jgi:hypothetical protein
VGGDLEGSARLAMLRVKMTGPPVAGSKVRRSLETSTRSPFLMYWLAVSAMRTQMVSTTYSPSRGTRTLMASEKLVTAVPLGV